MKKYITVAALLAAGTAFANAADASTVITDLTFANNASSGVSKNLVLDEDGVTALDKLTVTISGGKSWSMTSDNDSWTNTAALAEMNAGLGLALTAENINAYAPVSSGQGGSWTDLTLSIDSIAAGTEIVLYTLGTAAGSTMANFAVSGLTDAAVEYAVAGGSGFSSTAIYTDGTLNYTLIKVTGTLTESDIVLSARNANKNAWGMLAYAPVPVPEPSAFGLLAGIGALALVASRRRRK